VRVLLAWFVPLSGLLNQSCRDRDLAAGLQGHVQMHVDDNIHARVSPEGARRSALSKLGGVDQTKKRYLVKNDPTRCRR
jgi:macrolide transport system ATP-binding/permease protein